MGVSLVILLIAQALCFVLWAVLSFRALFQIRAIAAGRTGQMFPGPLSLLSALGVWLRDPARRGARILWTLSLLGIMVPSVIIALTRGGLE